MPWMLCGSGIWRTDGLRKKKVNFGTVRLVGDMRLHLAIGVFPTARMT